MAVVASATGAAVFGLSGVAAGVAGGALLGAGAGALYSGVTGDGDILNSALTGGLIGGAVGGLGAYGAGLAAPETAGAAGLLGGGAFAPAAGSGASFATPALASAAPTGANTVAGAALANASADPIMAASNLSGMSGAEIASMNAPATIPSAMSSLKDATPMTGNEMLGYGLAGTAALSLLGGMNQPKLSPTTGTTPGTIRPYTYSQIKNPNYGQPGESYYTQSYTAQPTYQAKNGGVIRMAAGGLPAIQTNMYPQSQEITTNFATPTQMPTSAEIIASDYDTSVNPYTGEPMRMADGGVSIDPNARAAFVPATNTPPVQVGLVPPPVVGNKYTIPAAAPSQAVTDYNKLLAGRAVEEYVKAPPMANTLPGGKYGTTDLTNQITQKYQDILGRSPDQPGLDYWLKQAQSGTKLNDIQNAFLGSQEYLAANPNAVAPQPVTAPVPTAVGGPSQADIDAYLAANPTTARTYDAKTQKYLAPTVTQAQIDAWKASTAGNTDLFAGMDPAILQTMYADYQRQQEQAQMGANGGLMKAYAMGGNVGQYNLGSYSDGGRLLKGPGDGVSDDIPAVIGDKQPARLADGEFVIPARIVSELGNGSTDAGAKRLYAMMDNIQAGRKKTVGKGNVAKDTKAKKHLLA